MKVAIPVWQGRVSPVFDSSRRILLLEVEDGRVIARREIDVSDDLPLNRSRNLHELGTKVLVCGAISRPLAELITSTGIRLIPFVAGSEEEIITAFLGGRLGDPEFQMPGCCGRRRRRHGDRRCLGKGG